MKLKMPMMPMPRRPKPARPKKLNAVVRASARTATDEDFEEDYSDSEPNMKLSHAFMVVLILHLVAIGAIVAFTSINAKKTKIAAIETAGSATAERTTADAPVTTKSETSIPQTQPVVEKRVEASAPAHAATKTIPASGDVHTVTSGESMPKIAAAYGVTTAALQKENGLSTYSMIKVGQKLKIPHATKASEVKKAPAVVTTAPQTAAVKTAAKTETPGTYEVKKGDNPFSIAKKFKVSSAELLKANGIDDPKNLQIGQKLKIPKTN
ncbi:MAG: LysM peptidoglycan-binding domain-containing protein [Chthoniobacterales bacterium]